MALRRRRFDARHGHATDELGEGFPEAPQPSTGRQAGLTVRDVRHCLGIAPTTLPRGNIVRWAICGFGLLFLGAAPEPVAAQTGSTFQLPLQDRVRLAEAG